MKQIDRRTVLQSGAAVLGSGLVMTTSAQHAVGQYLGQSYIEENVAPENMNDVLRWADQALLAVRDQGLTPPEASRVLGIGFMAESWAGRQIA